jgi:RNA polymerase sigma factor (sigma-70 family)
MASLLAHKPGVDRAFERIYRRHAVDVYRYAYAVLRNQADAEDVTQTTFMNAYRALERGETPQAPHNWLIAIAHNVCRQRFRQASRRVQEVGLEDDVADHFVHPEDDDAPTPADIKRALNQLAFNQRTALVMRELEGRSYAEIADLLDLSVSAVETLIFRARRALREQLEAALTCGQAEQLLSRQLDGELAKDDRGQLRAHLRECADCRRLARSQRAQRSALRALGAIPLPSSLASLFGGGASVGTAVAVKAAAAVITVGVVGGVGYDVHHRLMPPKTTAHHSAVVKPTHAAAPTPPPEAVVTASRAPVVAVAAPPARGHGNAKPNWHAKAHGHPHVPAVAVEPAAPVVPATPAAAVVPKHTGKPATHGRGNANGKARGHVHGHGRSRAGGAAPPTDDDSSPHGSGKPGNGNARGNPNNPEKPQKSQDEGLPIVTVPTLPVTVPDALTQTSQNQGARNDAMRHLHP